MGLYGQKLLNLSVSPKLKNELKVEGYMQN